MKAQLSDDDVSILMSRLPEEAGSDTRFFYDGITLSVPSDYDARVRSIIDLPNWQHPVASLDVGKAAKAAAVNAKREAIIAAGYTHPFGGTIGSRVLDQRGPEDVTSWLALKLMAQDLNSAEQGDTLLPIRDAKNATFAAKSSAVEAAMSAMGQWRASILQRSWVLKDQIDAAADKAALDAIDIDAGWPE